MFQLNSLVPRYSNNIENACMQRAAELLISEVIDKEIMRIQDLLSCDVFVIPGDDKSLDDYIYSVLTKEHEQDEIVKLNVYIDSRKELLDDSSIDPKIRENMKKEIYEKEPLLFQLEADTELAITRIQYYYTLESTKNTLINIIQDPLILSRIRKKNKHSEKLWIYQYTHFFRGESTVCYESQDFIEEQIDAIEIEMYKFKNRMREKK